MEGQKKCSNKKHSEINAISYCIECNLYLCNKCTNNHIEYLENHQIKNLDKNNQEIFSGLCKELNHKMKLEYFCNNHNTLCCAACLSVIKSNGNGQHSECDVVPIKEIKEEMKNKIDKDIKYLKESFKNLDESIKYLEEFYKMINKSKEELKLNISKIFTKIRNTVNEREDELLLELDNIYDNTFFKEDLIKKCEKLPGLIKNILEKGSSLNQDWNDENKLIENINDCLNIKNNINNIIEINEKIEKCKSEKLNIIFIPDNEENINCLVNIKNFGKLSIQDENLKEELNEEGLEKEAIETVMNEGKCSRQVAIKALRAHNGDPVEALLEVGN